MKTILHQQQSSLKKERGKTIPRLLGKMLLLVCFLIIGIGEVWGQDYIMEKAKPTCSTVKDGGYVEINVPYYASGSGGPNRALSGAIAARETGQSHVQDILYFQAHDWNDQKFPFSATVWMNGSEWKVYTIDNSGTNLLYHNPRTDVENNADENSFTFLRLLLYIPPSYVGKSITFSYRYNIDKTNDGNVYLEQKGDFPPITAPGYPDLALKGDLSSAPGMYQVTYNTPQAPIEVKWGNEGFSNTTQTTGTKNVPISDALNPYKVTLKYKYNTYYTIDKSATEDLPAFHQAQNFTATDSYGGNTLLRWSIKDTDLDNCQTGDQFEVQRSLNEMFSNSITVGSVDFKNTQTDYSLTDYTGKENLNGAVYYRIRRTKQPAWGWNFVQTCSIEKTMSHSYINTLTAKEIKGDDDSEGIKVEVEWELDAESLEKVWSEGSKIVIERVNETDYKTTTHEVTTPDDIKKGVFTDEIYETCKKYRYYAYVVPGNKKYDPQSKKEADYPDGEIKPVLMGKVQSLTASKGYYPDRTDLFWETDGLPIDRFSVQWRVYDSSQTDEDAGFSTLQGGEFKTTPGQTSYSFKDDRGNPGVVYEYRVQAITDCLGKPEVISSPIARGFRSPTGIISGRITYQYGDAISGVDVRLSSKEIMIGQSIQFGGSDGSYAQTDAPIGSTENFTIQAFIKPTGEQTATIIDADKYRLGLQEGKAAFSANSGTNWVIADSVTIPTNAFSQLTGLYDGTSLNIYVNGKLKKSISANSLIGSETNTKVTIGKGFTGYVDEVRLWNKGLNEVEVTQTYNRILAGNEAGLIAYWQLNDSVTDEFYDLSYSQANYNGNHGKIHSATLSTNSVNIPTPSQLALRGLTDKEGNYLISGIPYKGGGTSYTITPTHPIFSFDPKEKTVVISQSSAAISDVNFKDKTAIVLEGYVFYENSSIPVKDATFEVNDQPVVSNGDFIRSDVNGKFKFSVPTGEQTVRVKKANHTFQNNGLLLSSKGTNLNYQENMANLRFWDQTKVKLIGRVAGGTVEGGKPLGFSLSKNNLGDNPTIIIELEGDISATAYIYDKGAVYKDDQVDAKAPDQMDSLMIHWNNKYDNGVSYQQQQIKITPDSETGEYEAWLYPVKYKVTEVTATGWDNMLDGNSIADLENVFSAQTSEYTDTKKGETYRITYNSEFTLNKRVNPTISYKQGNAGGAKTEYFGLLNTTIPDLKGINPPDTLTLYDKTTKEYLFKDGEGKGLPIFSVGTWGFHIEATEDYYYNGKKIGTDVKVDRVPTQGGDVSITNRFNQNDKPQEAKLDDQGRAYVQLKMDNPRFAANDYGSIDFKVTIGATPHNAPQLKGLLLGADPKTDGLDFVTAGPIRLLNILRDPPGSHSYTWWESGQSYSFMEKSSKGFTNTGEETASSKLGMKMTTGIGIGSMVMTETDIENTNSAVVKHEEITNNPHARTMTVTTNTRYQTSDDPLNVGSAADVFIGFSNNIYYGAIKEIELLDKETYDGKVGKEKATYATAKKEGKTYYICSGTNMNVSVAGSTLFSYPKMHIENIVIPNLETLRNNLLYSPDVISEAEAQGMANMQKRMIYLSKVPKEDETFGSPKSYKVFAPKDYKEEEIVDPILSKLFNETTKILNGTPDSISMYNNAIKEWVRVLKQNEDEKLKAVKEADFVERNRSFHAAAPVEYTESYETAKEDGYSFEFVATAGFAVEAGFTMSGTGLSTSIQEQFGGVGSNEYNSTDGNTASSGFVLADEGDFDYLSVDILRVAPVDTAFKSNWDNMYNDLEEKEETGPNQLKKHIQYGNFVFKTLAGATACPYEPAEYTQYQDGTQKLLSQATMQIERPSLQVEKPNITNVPSDKAAVYNLKLMNDSQVAGATAIFTIGIVDANNQKGAKFSIDGVPLGEGRGIEVPYGEVLNKVLEVRRGTEYDYENLALVLKSQCQSDPTDNQIDIADTVYISAHFIPSSSDINIKSPTDKWTLNTQSSYDSISGKHYVPLTIDGFDVNFTGFDHIELQYKPSSSSDKDWTNICSYFTDSTKYKEASGVKAMIEGASITNRFFGAEDQKYDIRAVTFSKVGNEFVTKESPIISGIKDTKRPVVFGNIQPADGVLGIEDEIRLNFNEEIAEGYMTDVKNFQVTAIRNGSNGDHSTSLTFDGKAAYLATQAERNLANKDLTVEMWVQPAVLGQEMTLFSHGTSSEAFELSIGTDKSIKVRIGNKEYASKPQDFKTTDWAHVSMSYKASNRQLSAYFGGIEVITGVEAESYTGSGPMMFGRSVRGGNFFAGKMHEARVWNKVVSSNNIVANKLTIYTGQELGMMAYYPMNEGKGDRATDKAQGATAFMHGTVWSTLDGMSLTFKGDSILSVNTSQLALTDEKDYTLEFWFKADAGQQNAALVSNGKGIGEENNTSRNKVFVGFEEGKLLFRNNGHQEMVTGNWLDDNWHHFAISVNRNVGNAQIFIDGVLNCYFDAGKLGGFSATNLYLGARRWTEAAQMVDHTDMYLKGQIDELRLWDMALPSTYISNNYNVCPKGTEMGLMAYLPFSKYIRNSANVQELVFGGEDLVTGEALVDAVGEKFASTAKAPVRAKGPEVSIPFTFVVNKDALVINLMDTPEALEKTIVNFTVKDVSDLNGNLMQSPITWSAYINRNQLKWAKKSVTKEKKLYAQMNFTVDVENQGGTEKNFTIEGLPAWLEASPLSGTIDPLGSQTISFVVNEGTNVGRYDEVVYVKGDNNVAEALPITLKVFDEQPDWTVDPADFAFSMNVFGKIRVNKLFSVDAEDMLAVFDGDGRCVGVANNQYVKNNDMWYVFLTVYGNSRISSDLEFRVWDASTGLVYDAYPSEEISFVSDVVRGSASAPIVFDAEERVIQNINLKEGWNWVSFRVASELLSNPAGLLKMNLLGDEQIKDETNGLFASYEPTSKSWLGDDIRFDNKHMFLIQSAVPQKLSVSGITIREKEDLTLNIVKGWNYIGYLPSVNLPIREALSGYEAKEGDIIKSQNAFSMYGVTTGWLGDLAYMEPGKGYMLSSSEATQLVYPDMSAGSGLRSDIMTRSGDVVAEAIYTDNRYEANMSVVATVAENLPIRYGDKLLAYVDGELRGAALLTNNPNDDTPLYFITIGGDRNDKVSFALERGGEVIGETSPMFDYRSNNVQGNIEQPIILDFINDLQISVYPNPFDRELNFVMNTEAGDKVEIYLYTLNGQIMHRYSETSAADGYLHHRWISNDDLSSTVYMAVVVKNGQKQVYKVRKK